jgi:GNAT superfamily N-acetyltransferase
VPEAEQRFFRQDTTISERVEQWCSQLDYRHLLPLLAWNGDRIVADATLEQEPGLWTAHVAKIRLLVHPEFRRRGIGGRLLQELIELASESGLHKLVYECAADQTELMGHLVHCDFISAARLPDFIRDRNGKLHDMVLMVRDLNG